MNTPYITNIKEDDPGIKVLCPNNQYLTSTYTTDLSFPNLLPTAKSAHLFEQLTSGSLLPVGQLCNAGCQAFFDVTRMVIFFQQKKIVLIGTRKRGGLWYVDATDSITQTPNSLRNFLSTFLESSTMNATSNLILPSPTSRINSTILFTSTHTINVLDPHGLLTDRVLFYHASFGFPVISTFCKAFDAHHLISLPGHLTSLEKVIITSPFSFAVIFLFVHNSFSSPLYFTSSSASSLLCEKIDQQSRLRETEAFIQANSPWSVPGSLAEAPSFPNNLGTCGMVLPSMRAPSTGNNIALNMFPATKIGWIRERKPCFWCLVCFGFC